VENFQDIIEQVLLDSQFKGAAKAYILYRNSTRCCVASKWIGG
jgi:hypothetical protein